jgi:hypothetical protein
LPRRWRGAGCWRARYDVIAAPVPPSPPARFMRHLQL